MNKTILALKLADKVISRYRNETPIGNQPHMICHVADDALAAIREALFEQGVPIVDEYGVTCRAAITKAEQALQNLSDFHQHIEATEPRCSDHSDAPHGFDRNASHNAGRYVCECEGWSPDEVVKYPGCDYCNDELFSGRKCKCCGKVFIENVEQGIDDLRQQNAALKAVVDAWNNVEPVKQEPAGLNKEEIKILWELAELDIEWFAKQIVLCVKGKSAAAIRGLK
jgi:hypothetical protein